MISSIPQYVVKNNLKKSTKKYSSILKVYEFSYPCPYFHGIKIYVPLMYIYGVMLIATLYIKMFTHIPYLIISKFYHNLFIRTYVYCM